MCGSSREHCVCTGVVKMLLYAVFGLLLFAVVNSAIITVDDLQQEAKKVEQWGQEKVKEVESVQKEAKNGEVLALEKLNEVENWAKNEITESENFLAELNPKLNNENCVCYRQTCGCCIHAEEPEIHLNSTVCVNVTYLSEDYGISFTVTLNNHTLYNETVSVRNPPPVCVGFPYVKEFADVCVRLYNIDATSHNFHACARLEARMKFVIIAHYDLGCFTIGSLSSGEKKEQAQRISSPSVILI